MQKLTENQIRQIVREQIEEAAPVMIPKRGRIRDIARALGAWFRGKPVGPSYVVSTNRNYTRLGSRGSPMAEIKDPTMMVSFRNRDSAKRAWDLLQQHLGPAVSWERPFGPIPWTNEYIPWGSFIFVQFDEARYQGRTYGIGFQTKKAIRSR